ncbi:DUF58 domain-containing protein [Thalassolituus hydrocarboniclasticus]|uniref:DUF58 domain-containing protein n=1 Tax=Thalassolituus hydrocarboniclasticus TaxID=2742796 RepID=A0ABY6A9S0_9GAMM|nr:DUF58 domain-containing protein [Thalassolituus hydrocarboniclasticus]UXD87134.1 DUF58 domain-containing protein [Thalassolituus hydrocarboniclasticus]
MRQDGHFSAGAEILPANLVQLRALARQLPLHKQKKVLNDLAGSHASAIRGRGLDYAEVREYQAGDDIRAMDWRVTARTGDAHIKVFREEKERPILLVCDLRANMRFGSRRALKQVLAADLTALFAWAALEHGDRIGALLFNDEQETDLRPKTGRKQVLQLLNELTTIAPSASADPQQRMQQICRHLRRIARPGSAVYFISDWTGFDADCEQQLHAVTRHCDLVAVHISDPLEAELPPPGLYSLSDGQQRLALDSTTSRQREEYQQAFSLRMNSLQQQLQRLKVPLIALSTSNADPLPALRQGLGLGMLSRVRAEES